MSNKEVIMIFEDGSAKAIYSDELMPFVRSLGPVKVSRVSTVEWEGGDTGGWAVRAEHDQELALRLDDAGNLIVSKQGVLKLFPTRAEALEREVAMFWDLIPKEKSHADESEAH